MWCWPLWLSSELWMRVNAIKSHMEGGGITRLCWPLSFMNLEWVEQVGPSSWSLLRSLSCIKKGLQKILLTLRLLTQTEPPGATSNSRFPWSLISSVAFRVWSLSWDFRRALFPSSPSATVLTRLGSSFSSGGYWEEHKGGIWGLNRQTNDSPWFGNRLLSTAYCV